MAGLTVLLNGDVLLRSILLYSPLIRPQSNALARPYESQAPRAGSVRVPVLSTVGGSDTFGFCIRRDYTIVDIPRAQHLTSHFNTHGRSQ